MYEDMALILNLVLTPTILTLKILLTASIPEIKNSYPNKQTPVDTASKIYPRA